MWKIEETVLTASDIIKLIDQRVLNERDRKLLRRRYIDGITYEQLAEEFDLSRAQVCNIVYKYQKRIFKGI